MNDSAGHILALAVIAEDSHACLDVVISARGGTAGVTIYIFVQNVVAFHGLAWAWTTTQRELQRVTACALCNTSLRNLHGRLLTVSTPLSSSAAISRAKDPTASCQMGRSRFGGRLR